MKLLGECPKLHGKYQLDVFSTKQQALEANNKPQSKKFT